jgi:Mad3/BUB1 homology region 1
MTFRYKNDARYVGLWMKVMHTTKDPIEVFKYLAVNKIGDKLSIFYEKYASLLEFRQR